MEPLPLLPPSQVSIGFMKHLHALLRLADAHALLVADASGSTYSWHVVLAVDVTVSAFASCVQSAMMLQRQSAGANGNHAVLA